MGLGAWNPGRRRSVRGLPIETEWLEPLGVLSLLVEGLFMGVYLAIIARPKEETGVVEASTSAGSSG